MSQKEQKSLKKENTNIPQPVVNKKDDMNEIKEITDEFQDISKEILAEDFDFFQEESKRTESIEIIGGAIKEIKNNKDNNIDLDEYIKDCIENLEEYVSIFSFEDLIYDPEYALKSLMKSLKKVINFHYFYTKFTLPKDKNEYKEKELLNESENKNQIQYKKEIKDIKNEIKKPENKKTKQVEKNICEENKNEIIINKEFKEEEKESEQNNERNNLNKEEKEGKKNEQNNEKNNLNKGEKEGKESEQNNERNNLNKGEKEGKES